VFGFACWQLCARGIIDVSTKQTAQAPETYSWSATTTILKVVLAGKMKPRAGSNIKIASDQVSEPQLETSGGCPVPQGQRRLALTKVMDLHERLAI
jgi:hypothetical protein